MFLQYGSQAYFLRVALGLAVVSSDVTLRQHAAETYGIVSCHPTPDHELHYPTYCLYATPTTMWLLDVSYLLVWALVAVVKALSVMGLDHPVGL